MNQQCQEMNVLPWWSERGFALNRNVQFAMNPNVRMMKMLQLQQHCKLPLSRSGESSLPSKPCAMTVPS
jgi:hypothetical protein